MFKLNLALLLLGAQQFRDPEGHEALFVVNKRGIFPWFGWWLLNQVRASWVIQNFSAYVGDSSKMAISFDYSYDFDKEMSSRF